MEFIVSLLAQRRALPRFFIPISTGLIGLFFILTTLNHAFAQSHLRESEDIQLENSQATAQFPYDSIANSLIETAASRAVKLGDIDGDGDLDLAIANDGAANKILLNDKGTFEQIGWQDNLTDHTEDVVLADIDGDGDLDLIVGNNEEANKVYRNDAVNADGSLTLTLIWTAPISDATQSLAVGDMDGNGYLDLIVGNWESSNKIYLNGGGTFDQNPAWQDDENYQTAAIDVGDANGDGRLDIAVANMCPDYPTECQPDQLYLNTTDTSFSFELSWQRFNRSTTDLAWGDLDGDNQLELAMVENIYNSHKVYQYDDTTGEMILFWYSLNDEDLGQNVAWGDANGDGRQDLLVGNSSDAPERLYLNNGETLEVDPEWTTDDTIANYDLAFADIDNDGDKDFIGAYGNLIKIYQNKDHPIDRIATPLSDQSVYTTQDIVWGDINGDGLLDLIEGNSDGPNIQYFNDGNGFLSKALPELGNENSYSLALGDINFDGDLDLAVGNVGSPNQIFINDGNGFNNNDFANFGGNADTYDLAWGDFDGDGDLDLATANYDTANIIYVNINDNLGIGDETIELGGADENTRSVAWGDIDQDGDLDLLFGNENAPNLIYINDNGSFDNGNVFSFGENEATYDVAWGDVDGDGDLDVAVANIMASNQLYCNEGGFINPSPCWVSLDTNDSRSIAWGDADGDGDLDLAVGNARGDDGSAVEPDKIYFNKGTMLQTAASSIWVSEKGTDGWLSTLAVAWADVDHDGDLDLAAGGRSILGNGVSGSSNGQSRLYMNSLHQGVVQELGSDTQSIVIGLYSNIVERNQNHSSNALGTADFFANPVIREGETVPISYTLYHPDSQPARFVRAYFSLDGGGQWFEALPSTGSQTTNLASLPYPTQSVANQHVFEWDIIKSGFFGQSDNVIFRIEAFYDAISPNISSPSGTYLYTNQSAPDMVQTPPTSNSFPFRARGNQIRVLDQFGNNGIQNAIVYQLPNGQLTGGEPIADSHQVPFKTNLFGFLQGRGRLLPGDRLVGMKAVDYGGLALASLAFDGIDDLVDFGVVTETAVLQNEFTISAWVQPEKTRGIQYIVGHSRFNSENGFGLALENNGLRFSAHGVHEYSSTKAALVPGEWYHIAAVMDNNNDVSFYVNGEFIETVTGDAPLAANHDDRLLLGGTEPFGEAGLSFRFIGGVNEVRIWEGARTSNQLQLEMNQSLPESDIDFLIGYWPIYEGEGGTIKDVSENNNDGYLGGIDEAYDEAFEPTWQSAVPQDPTYTVYHTSAAPSETGLEMTAVPETLGLISLKIDPDNTLTLYDLDISLEWDARNDPTFMEQISADMERASQILFDLTNGQAAFGEVRIFHDKENWLDADVIVYASNNHRPNANLGGLVVEATAETIDGTSHDEAYMPGQIRMGATWNRFGNTSGNLGEDWPRALAHEFGHYGLFLLDNYLGVENGLLIETNCPGSAMSDAYIYSEFLTREDWLGECLLTMAELTTGRTDWETISEFYDWMESDPALIGPSNLPLNVTKISFANLAEEPDSLASPFFGLLAENGSPLIFAESDAQAFLYKMTENEAVPNDVIALGAPNRDLINARGAEPGDELCVYGRAFSFIGCHTVGTREEPFTVYEIESWTPEVTVTPVTSRTVLLQLVNETAVSGITAQFIPLIGDSIDNIQLERMDGEATPTYSALVDLDIPTPSGFVRFIVEGSSPQIEATTQFYLGSGWNINRLGLYVNRPGLYVNRPGLYVNRPGLYINRLGLYAPMASSDGQVIIFSLENIFSDVVTYSLQSLTSLPDLEEWLAPVGQAYRFKSEGELPTSSITFSYLQRDVPGSYEDQITVFYRPEGSMTWERLDTRLDLYRNIASAPLEGEGTYLLAVTIITPELQEGWNLFAYPNTDPRPLPQALASIEDQFTSIYELQGNVWRLFDTTVLPEFEWLVNDLDILEPLHTYWIYAITETTPLIGVPDNLINQSLLFSLPPATYYGTVTSNGPSIPIDGTIQATIDGNVCGQAALEPIDDESWVYKIRVAADVGNDCGLAGRSVTFTIDGLPTSTDVIWNNTQAQNWNLVLEEPEIGEGDPETFEVYLPFVTND